MKSTRIAAFATGLALTVAAHGPGHEMGGGEPGDAAKVTRTIEVVASDNEFSLKSLQVKDGETVRFVVRNDGLDPHALYPRSDAALIAAGSWTPGVDLGD